MAKRKALTKQQRGKAKRRRKAREKRREQQIFKRALKDLTPHKMVPVQNRHFNIPSNLANVDFSDLELRALAQLGMDQTMLIKQIQECVNAEAKERGRGAASDTGEEAPAVEAALDEQVHHQADPQAPRP